MATIFGEYLYWHFAVAPGEIIQIMINYIKAVWRRFLITQHFKTLFSPWHRRQPSDFGDKAQANIGSKLVDLMADFYIRILAAFIRTVVTFIGLISEIVVLVCFLTFVVFWLFWPLISIYLFVSGVALLI